MPLPATPAGLQTANTIIDHYEEETRRLKANLTWCLQTGLELGKRCNQTIRDLVKKYNDLNANYSLCREYLTKYYNDARWFRMWVWIMTAVGMASVTVVYLLARRHIKELEKELEQT